MAWAIAAETEFLEEGGEIDRLLGSFRSSDDLGFAGRNGTVACFLDAQEIAALQ